MTPLEPDSEDPGRQAAEATGAAGLGVRPGLGFGNYTVEVEGRLGLVMEVVDGPSLEQILDGTRLSLEEVDDLAG